MRVFSADAMTEAELVAFEQEREQNEAQGRFVFTPRLGEDESTRILMFISSSDWERIGDRDARGPGVKGVVTDLDTGSRWMVFGACCTMGDSCYCDATARLMEAEN